MAARILGKGQQVPKPDLPAHPFGTEPRASRERYLELHRAAQSVAYPEIDAVEEKLGFAIDRPWMEELALHTQVVVKESSLNYNHGRLLYAALRRYLAGHDGSHVVIFETGTARGFSALCMACALQDAAVPGYIVTVDMLPHERPILWNCIDDHEGPKTRQQLLSAYPELLSRIVFLQGRSDEAVATIGLLRVNFAFLDATHSEVDVRREFEFVSARQRKGDVVILDDVTPAAFPGVVAAVEAIEAGDDYAVERIVASEQRGYAIAKHR
ncbi:class I SAM-dependent methyltransferase [Pelagibius litoralis]|uniref:Class I SAM-dependent methyltransferase n=1 Tax=Pelagibius litoralis TaxID=374515 RepID=A0A967C954_9PROT|nr:class I SAM-dependent methyltransferase [Pelagibius litoralis]